MKNQILNTIRGVFTLSLSIALMTGCITERENLVHSKKVSVEIVNSKRTQVSTVRVYNQNDEILIRGGVKRRGLVALAGGGHVDIEVLNSDGELIATGLRKYTPQRITPGHTSRFTQRFQNLKVNGGTVRIAHHSRPHREERTE